MIDENLAQRKSWFRFFPDGTIEFTVITRVLAIMFLTGLAMVSIAQRPVTLTLLWAVIWVDYALMLWWTIEINDDLEDLSQSAPVSNELTRRRRFQEAVLLAIPSIVVMILLVPWPQMVIAKQIDRDRLYYVLVPVVILAFSGSAYLARYATRQLGLSSWLWRVVLLIPGLHWFAMHRLVSQLEQKVGSRLHEKSGTPHTAPSIAGAVADVTLIISLCSWLGWVRWIQYHPTGAVRMMLQIVGLGSGALFAIIDLAVMEHLQRRFVTLIRKL